MVVNIPKVKEEFASMIETITAEPMALSEFVVWLDLKLAEYKINGYMMLDPDDSTMPEWLASLNFDLDKEDDLQITSRTEFQSHDVETAQVPSRRPVSQSRSPSRGVKVLPIESDALTSCSIISVTSLRDINDKDRVRERDPQSKALGVESPNKRLSTSGVLAYPTELLQSKRLKTSHIVENLPKANVYQSETNSLLKHGGTVSPGFSLPIEVENRLAMPTVDESSVVNRPRSSPGGSTIRGRKVTSTITHSQSDIASTSSIPPPFVDIDFLSNEPRISMSSASSDSVSDGPAATVPVPTQLFVNNQELRKRDKDSINHNMDNFYDTSRKKISDDNVNPDTSYGNLSDDASQSRQSFNEPSANYSDLSGSVTIKSETPDTEDSTIACTVATDIAAKTLSTNQNLAYRSPTETNEDLINFMIKDSLSGRRDSFRGLHVCSKCDFSTPDEVLLLKHMQEHANKLCKCYICGQFFEHHSRLKKHIELQHNQVVFPCDQCGHCNESLDELNAHRQHVHGMRQDMAALMGDSEDASSNATSRKAPIYLTNNCQETEGVICTICGALLSSRSSYIRHRQGMHESKIYTCQCGQEFRWRTSLKRHMIRCRTACEDGHSPIADGHSPIAEQWS